MPVARPVAGLDGIGVSYLRPEYVTIGRIVSTFGNKGQVKVVPETDFPDRFLKICEVWVKGDEGLEKVRIKSARRHTRNTYVCQIEGIDSIAAAEKLRDRLIQVPASRVMDLRADAYYIFDIVGLEVYTGDGRFLGKVAEVLTGPGNDVFVINGIDPPGEILLPAVKSVVTEINLADRYMRIDPLPGLISGT